MSEIVIRAKDLRKVYRLYTKPSYRFRDMFGLLGRKTDAYTEHKALDGVDLEIGRGEKVAIIGRNGAGKSTLLRLLTHTIEPTSGEISVKGDMQALLQIGTGFHPDFTGRENVLAYLAQIGVDGAEAERLCVAATEFAELEEYIDQPVKTYSTGMAVRLMFSASTVLRPDILVLDEVLGVGDAYFAQKSFERIQDLCDRSGTTLLLVTHDVYSAMRLCDRFVWLDRGRLIADGPSRDVIHAYERSIREQEEHRLRLKRMAAAARELASRQPPLYGQIELAGQTPPAGRVFVSEIRVIENAVELARVSMDPERSGQGVSLELAEGDGNWGPVVQMEGRMARGFLSHGSIFHRLPFLVTDPRAKAAVEGGTARLEVTVWADSAVGGLQAVVCDADGRSTHGGSFEESATSVWQVLDTALVKGERRMAVAPHGEVARYGTRSFEVTDVRFFDESGNETQQFGVGGTLKVGIDYRINDPAFDERPTIIVAFQKDGVTRSHRFWTRGVGFNGKTMTAGRLDVVAEPHLLGAGTYAVTISVFREGYFDSKARHRFFSANPEVLDIHSRGYEIVVRQSPEPLCNDVVFQHLAHWYLNGQPVADTEVVQDHVR